MYVGVIFNQQKKMKKGWNDEKLINSVYRVYRCGYMHGRKDRSIDPMHAHAYMHQPTRVRSKLDRSLFYVRAIVDVTKHYW